MSKTNAVAVAQEFTLPAIPGDLAEILATEMDGLNIEFDRVKIPSGGGLAFEVPGESGEPEMVKEITGVIVDHYGPNAFWAKKYSGEKNPPDCASLDGKTGVERDGGEARSCRTCPRNQWGSAEDGIGKACKNMHRIYLLTEGNMLPILLTLPPTSIKAFADYLGKRVVSRGLRSYEVLTRVSLRREKSRSGSEYSQAVFSTVCVLPQELQQQAAVFAASIKDITRMQPIEIEDYEVRVEGTAEDEDVPF